jgi:N-alpha-acetyl-L-2,4-diaminobutyrate deacetylase
MPTGEAEADFHRDLVTAVDFERDGRQIACMELPDSHAPDGGAAMLLPIVVFRNGPGPSVLLTGGNHGDEFEGPVALMRLVHELDWTRIRGRVIVLPCLNPPAVLAGRRCSPYDGRNMNRVFPGRAQGTITEKLAHHVTTTILPLVDAVFDLHAGGRSSFIIPSVMMHYLDDAGLMARTRAALEAFRAPVSVIIKETDTAGMFDTTVEDMGKVFICAELGGAGVLTPESMRVATAGVRNILIHCGIIDGEPTVPGWRGWPDSRAFEVPTVDHYVSSPADGMFEPLVEIGDRVEPGQPIARIHVPMHPGHRPILVKPRVGGVLFSRRAATLVRRGDSVGIVALPSAGNGGSGR